jgi:hypothetical protein
VSSASKARSPARSSSNTTLTAAGGGIFELGAGEIRCNIATATAVYAMALRIPDGGF